MSNITLFEAQTTDASSIEFAAAGVNPNQNSLPILGMSGDFDGATVSLEWQDPLGNWVATDPVNDIWTNVALQTLDINSFNKYRLTISGSGGSTSINAWVFGGLEV